MCSHIQVPGQLLMLQIVQQFFTFSSVAHFYQGPVWNWGMRTACPWYRAYDMFLLSTVSLNIPRPLLEMHGCVKGGAFMLSLAFTFASLWAMQYHVWLCWLHFHNAQGRIMYETLASTKVRATVTRLQRGAFLGGFHCPKLYHVQRVWEPARFLLPTMCDVHY